MKNLIALTFTILTVTFSCASDPGRRAVVPSEPDRWKFLLSIPGWMPSLEGDTGVNGLISRIDLDPGDIIRHYDFAATFRTETSKGRFGITTDFLYTSLSDGIGTSTAVQKLDLQVDQLLAELALRWRLIDGPRGYLDVTAGVRYTNLFQQIVTQASAGQIEDAAEAFGDELGERVRAQIDDALSEGKLRTVLRASLHKRILNAAGRFTRPNPPQQTLPAGPLAGPRFGRLGRDIDNLVQRKARELVRAAGAEARAAVQAEIDALRATTAAARAAARQRAAELRARVNRRIADTRRKLEKEIENKLHDALDARAARTDDWWDPIIGLRSRYNFNDRFYISVRGDVGGFGMGSEFTWQAEGALGCQLTPHIFAEAGYRAFGVDYEKDGLVYDVIMHGAQVTLGIEF